MEPKGIPWYHSPRPSRTPSPIQPVTNDYLESLDGLSLLSYRSRARRDRPIAKDPQHLLSRIEESPSSQATDVLKSPLLVAAPSYNLQTLDNVYPRDEPGEEISDFARVWRVYVDEAAKYDNLLIEGCNRGIDVLLVFTGLFSAVLTTFIIQSFQLLLPDPNQATNQLLAELVAAQTDKDPSLPTDNPPVSGRQTHWVNGLWFAALACSLSTALISMLSKQWLQAYASRSSSSPRQMTRERQRKYMHLLSWHVLGIINSMPLLLHLALLLFFAGTVILLWSVDYRISVATFIIVGFAYAFYFISIWLPFFYPNCPYQHPIYEPLKRWLSAFHQGVLVSNTSPMSPKQPRRLALISDDELDAYAVVWLFNHSTDKEVVSIALRAIAGLPRDFGAIHVLRSAGAVKLVELAFQSCFEKDTTIDLKWHLNDPDGAWLYCKAWMNLTRGTLEQWPLDLLEPLYKLQDLRSHPDGAAIASCVVAVSSVDSHLAQWELLAYLSKYASGELHLSPSTLTWLLDSMIEGSVNWEMPAAIIEKTTLRAVPVLLRLLRHIEGLPTSNLRSAIGVALYIYTAGPINLDIYCSEGRRRDFHCEDMIIALSTIVSHPERFGIQDELWDIVAQEFTRLVSPMVSQYYRFSTISREKARWSLYELMRIGYIGVDQVPDLMLTDILHLLNPLPDILADQHPQMVRTLVEILSKSTRPEVANGVIHLLMPLLSKPSPAILEAFIDSDGVSAVLRAAKFSDFDNRRLQVDSWRALCSLITTCTTRVFNPPPSPRSAHQMDITKAIFATEFFDALSALILARRWTLLNVSGNWPGALLGLFYMQPHEPAWRTLVKVIRDAHSGESEAEHEGMIDLAKTIYKSIRHRTTTEDVNGGVSPSSDDGPEALSNNRTNHPVTLMEQRQPMKRDGSPAPTSLVRGQPFVERKGSPAPRIFDPVLMVRQHVLPSRPFSHHRAFPLRHEELNLSVPELGLPFKEEGADAPLDIRTPEELAAVNEFLVTLGQDVSSLRPGLRVQQHSGSNSPPRITCVDSQHTLVEPPPTSAMLLPPSPSSLDKPNAGLR